MRKTIVLLTLLVTVAIAAVATAASRPATLGSAHPQWFKVSVSVGHTGDLAAVRRGSVQSSSAAIDLLRVRASVENIGQIVHSGNVRLSLSGPSGYRLEPVTVKLTLDHPYAVDEARRGPAEARRGSVQGPSVAMSRMFAYAATVLVPVSGTYSASVVATHVADANDPAEIAGADQASATASALVQ